ncbi:MAG: hypothetical protein M1476_01330 [Candidatus Thermoplasmatota archaeon]|nr:hypothetical protein [Candidatus Thermoplasmatota archaeon]
MTRTFRLTDRHREILSYLESGTPIREIAKKIGISHKNIIFNARRLQKHGYLASPIRTTQSIYPFMPLGQKTLDEFRNQMGTTVEKNPHPVGQKGTIDSQTQRLHALQVKYLLKEPLDPDSLLKLTSFKGFPVRPRPLKNHTDYIVHFQDFRAIITSRSIIIAGLQLELSLAESTYDLLFGAFQQVDLFIEQVEKKLQATIPRLKVLRNDRGILSGEIIRLEIAHTRDIIAKHVLRDGAILRLTDPGTGKPRVIVDNSKGVPEFEFIQASTAVEDNEKLRTFKNDLGPDKYKQWANDFFIKETLNPWKEAQDIKDMKQLLKQVITDVTERVDITQQQLQSLTGAVMQFVSAAGGIR